MINKIISGGQTGVDRAALDAAINNNIPHGGWCPRGRLAEYGVIDERYKLTETESNDYAQRTEWNVRDTDGTLILNTGRLQGGTAFTAKVAESYKKPCLIVDLDEGIVSMIIATWMTQNNIKSLNMAGPRESKQQGIYKKAYLAVEKLIQNFNNV